MAQDGAIRLVLEVDGEASFMSNHPQRFKILGFFDAPLKAHGKEQITYFHSLDQYEADHIPSQEKLSLYARFKGYTPRDGKCEPIYEIIGEGLEYCNCLDCFPSGGEVTDNRKTVDA